jgi:hypothetical protein
MGSWLAFKVQVCQRFFSSYIYQSFQWRWLHSTDVMVYSHWIEQIVDVPFRLSIAAARRLMASRYTSRLKSPAASGILHHTIKWKSISLRIQSLFSLLECSIWTSTAIIFDRDQTYSRTKHRSQSKYIYKVKFNLGHHVSLPPLLPSQIHWVSLISWLLHVQRLMNLKYFGTSTIQYYLNLNAAMTVS